jgi:hypothetical protein
MVRTAREPNVPFGRIREHNSHVAEVPAVRSKLLLVKTSLVARSLFRLEMRHLHEESVFGPWPAVVCRSNDANTHPHIPQMARFGL